MASHTREAVNTPVRMTTYAIIFALSIFLPPAGAQYGRSPGAQYYLLLAGGPAEVVAMLLWLGLRQKSGVKAALRSSGWVVLASVLLSVIAIVLGGMSYQWGVI